MLNVWSEGYKFGLGYKFVSTRGLINRDIEHIAKVYRIGRPKLICPSKVWEGDTVFQ